MAIGLGHLDAIAVHEALRQLQPVQREALELGYLGGMSQAEVAATTRTPLVKSRMRGLVRYSAANERATSRFSPQ